MDLQQVLKDFHDYLAPRLDTYEQAIYLYLFRHSRLVDVDEIVVGFKSARRRMACGIGEKGKPMAENTVYDKLQSLQQKGCIALLDTNHAGRRIRLNLPSEIPGLLGAGPAIPVLDLEQEDFFAPENRDRILLREGSRCFYCLRQLSGDNFVIEHVVSRPVGTGSYRNVVAACRQCNNRKGASMAEDWIRTLYREGFLDATAFQERLSHLERLRAGDLKPVALAG